MAEHDGHLHEVLGEYAKFLQDKNLALDKDAQPDDSRHGWDRQGWDRQRTFRSWPKNRIAPELCTPPHQSRERVTVLPLIRLHLASRPQRDIPEVRFS